MKTDSIKKLYVQLDPKEQARLAFEAFARSDFKEIGEIINCVPKLTYQSLHLDYRTQVHGLINLSLTYAIAHWKTQALMSQSFNAYLLEKNEDLVVLAKHFFFRLHAIEKALAQVCEREKISMTNVKTLTGCVSVPASNSSEYFDPELISEYIESFNLALNGS